MKIIKRNHSIESYNPAKAKKAIKKAFQACSVKIEKQELDDIVNSIDVTENMEVEIIQDEIEKLLMEHNYPSVAKEFILYRKKHAEIRKWVENKNEFIEKYKKASNSANSTIDDNSNVANKNIAILNTEIHKPDNIQISRRMIMDKLSVLFPNFKTKQYVKDLEEHIIYKHDESSFAGAIAPYCCSITMYPFLNNGIKGIGGLSTKPNNLDSFCGIYCNLIFATSSMFAGAVATSEFLLYFDYFCRKEWGDDYIDHINEFRKFGKDVLQLQKLSRKNSLILNIEDIEKLKDSDNEETKILATKLFDSYKNGKCCDETRTIKSIIHQHFQQVIYTISQPSAARGFQAAFVNFSYFDKSFFDGMFGNFFFPDGTAPIWDTLNWIQKDFMRWFNEERLRTLLTFPVESFALVYKDGKFLDEENADFVAEEYSKGHSFFTYISDTVDSLSSCCFTKETRVMYSIDNKIYAKADKIEDVYEKYQNKNLQVLYLNPKTKESLWRDATIIKANTNRIIKISFSSSKKLDWQNELNMTPDHIMPILRDGEIQDVYAKDLKNTDKLIVDKLIFDKSEYTDIEDFRDIKFININKIEYLDVTANTPVYCFRFISDKNPYFVLSNGIITHNCRLKNKVSTHEFSFTNGNMGVSTGSKSVITLNLNRNIQDFWRNLDKDYKNNLKLHITGSLKDENYLAEDNLYDDDFYNKLFEYLLPILDRIYKYHTAYNELLWDMYDANLLPVYKAGFINLNKQYLTIGINGLNQAAEFLGIKCNDNKNYQKFCQKIFSFIKENNTKNKFDEPNSHQRIFNCEQVPAESLAIKNYNWDKEDGYWVPKDTNLYASYIYKPNDENISIFEKLRLHGSNYIGDYLDGGAAAHINLSEHLSKEQNKIMLKYAAEHGCQYFTWNVPNSECTECGWIGKTPVDKCPNCGSEKIDYYDRVIGYLTRIKNWSDGRQIEQKTRVYLNHDQINENK